MDIRSLLFKANTWLEIGKLSQWLATGQMIRGCFLVRQEMFVFTTACRHVLVSTWYPIKCMFIVCSLCKVTSACFSLPKHLTFWTLYVHADRVWNIRVFCVSKIYALVLMGHDTVDSCKWVLMFQRDVLPVSLQLKLNPEDGSCRMFSKGWQYE